MFTLLAPLAVLVLWCGIAHAQTTFAVEVSLGGALPIGAAVQDAALLDAEIIEGQRTGVPGLWRLYPGAGLQAGVRVVTGSSEFGYSLHTGPWSHARRFCEGDRTVQRLPDGELEDGGVRWDCGGPELRRGLASTSSASLLQHDLTVAQRFRLELNRGRDDEGLGIQQGGRIERYTALYAVVGGGLTLASWRVAGAGDRINAGVHVVAGVGMELPFSRSWGLVVDTRYRFVIRGSPATFSASSGHAVARDATVFAALADWSQQLGLTLSIRYTFR